MKPFVISISAVSGGGKTTIVNLLKKRLSPCSVLYFDDYTFAGSPSNLCEWAQKGADFNVWNLAPLKKDIETKIKEPNTVYLLLDYPFGYENDMLRPLIDFAVFIDTPLDVALCRRIQRDCADQSAEELLSELEFYTISGRTAYLPMLYQVRPNVDLIIDGTLSPDSIAGLIMHAVQSKKPQA